MTISLIYPMLGLMACLGAVGVVFTLWTREKKRSRRLAAQLTLLKKSREKFQLIAANSEEGIVIVQNFKVLYANAKALDLFGISKDLAQEIQDGESSLSGNLSDYIYPDDLALALVHYEKIMLANEGKTEFTIRISRPHDTYIWVQVRSMGGMFRGEPVNLSFIRDATGLKLMEKDLQRAQRMEAIGVLSGGIAHDFNNILTTIIGNAELALMDLNENDLGSDEFVTIQEAGYRARDLVQQLLTLSREQGAGMVPLCPRPVVKEALKLLRSSFPSNIQITDRIQFKTETVWIDASEFYQVFMNLCTNAKDAMADQEKGELVVGLGKISLPAADGTIPDELSKGTYMQLTVQDDGAGIDPMILEKVFEPYFTTKAQGHGTGLGLTASLGIIRKYRGTITLETEFGFGSLFSVFLPLDETDMAESGGTPQPSKGQGNILFADDEKEICFIVKKLFENLGYNTAVVGSGKEALALFEQNPGYYDLMVTDMGMPGMTGEQLVRHILEIRPDLPMILCTGHSDKIDLQKAKELGIKEYIQKPYSLKDLAGLVARHIEKT